MDFLEALDYQTRYKWHYYKEKAEMPEESRDYLCILENSLGNRYTMVLTLGMMTAYAHILYAWQYIAPTKG